MSIDSVKAFLIRMTLDEEFAQKIVQGKNKKERMKIVANEGFSFSAEEFNELAKNGAIKIDPLLSHLAHSYEGKGIRIFTRPGTGLFD